MPEPINPYRGWQALEARLQTTTDPRLRQVLEVVRDHLKGEALGDFDLLMSTLADDPQYHFWGAGPGNFSGGPKGYDAVVAHYRGVYEENRQVVDWNIERIVVDTHCVVTEGPYRQLYPGRAVQARGIEVDDPDAVYEASQRLVIFWPFNDEGKLIGEDCYGDSSMFGEGRLRKLDPSEVPEQYYLTQT